MPPCARRLSRQIACLDKLPVWIAVLFFQIQIVDVKHLVCNKQTFHILVLAAVRHLAALFKPYKAARLKIALVGMQRAGEHIHPMCAVVVVQSTFALMPSPFSSS